MNTWVKIPDTFGAQSIKGEECEIVLTRRPAYCDRGNFLATIFPTGKLAMELDYADGWNPGRYYMDEERAKAEIEAWLIKRKQAI